MYRINQARLSQLCVIMNNADDDYIFYLQYGIKDVTNWFNTYWISKESKKIADDIRQHLNTYIRGISKVFDNLNNKIKKEVINYNNSPENKFKLYYKGFFISKPYNINKLSNLNKTLPDGKIGSLPRETNMTYPITKFKVIIGEITDIFKKAIMNIDVISYEEKLSIQCLIIEKEKQFINSIEYILQIIIEKYN